jgi:phosphoglycolate phosphatase
VLLCFDYDGVFVDSLDDLLDKACRAQRAVGVGRQPSREDFRTTRNLTFEQVGRDLGIPEEKLLEYGLRFFELQNGDDGFCQMFDGMAEVIRELSVKHTIVIITSSVRRTVERALEHYELLENISFIFDGTQAGSKSEKIGRAVEEFSARLDQTVMIGDCVSDIREGKMAGVRTIAVTWGFQSSRLLLSESPDYVAERPHCLLAVVNSIL